MSAKIPKLYQSPPPDALGPLNPGVPARHPLVDTTWTWALNRQRLQAPILLFLILFQTAVDSTIAATHIAAADRIPRSRKVTSSTLTICDTRLILSYNADPRHS
jgi:hypothetical protein